MNLQQLTTEILEHLFQGYLEHGGTPIFDVTQIITENGYDYNEVGNYLVKSGLVKNQRFNATGFSASINMSGIMKVHPEFIQEKKEKLISTLGVMGNPSSDILEILDLEPKDYQIGFDLAKLFESLRLIEVRFGPTISVKLSLEGRDYYERNKAEFI